RWLRVVGVDNTHVEAHVLNSDGTKARTTRILRRAWARRFAPAPPTVDTPGRAQGDARHALLTAAERQSVLAAGLAWLYQTTQPDGAIVHHGPSLPARQRTYTFHPSGPRGTPVVVVAVRRPQYEVRGTQRVLLNPLADTEMTEVTDALAAL